MSMQPDQFDQYAQILRDSNNMSRGQLQKLYEELLKKYPPEQTRELYKDNPTVLRILDRIKDGEFLKYVKLNSSKQSRAYGAIGPTIASPSFVLSRDELTGVISLNGKQFIRPQIESVPDCLMAVLMERNKTEHVVRLSSKELMQIKRNKKYAIPNVLTNLGFKGDLRAAFFPTSSKNALVFINPLYQGDLQKRRLSLSQLEAAIDALSRVRHKTNLNE